MKKSPLVCVVDDDESVRESLPDLLKEFGFAVEAFSSAEDFLASDAVSKADCLILDIAMPRMSGPDLQRELRRRGRNTPIVFITAHSEASIRPRTLRQGAVACLFKPFSQSALFDALSAALPAG
jgi:FixJ family two-component response regulator